MFHGSIAPVRRGAFLILAVGLHTGRIVAAAPEPEIVALDEILLDHQPVEEHPPRRPIPLVAVAEDERVTRVVLRYRVRKRWKRVVGERHGREFHATLPCSAVTGASSVSYYFEALNRDGDVLDNNGDELEPHTVHLAPSSDRAAHFPGEPPPRACDVKEPAAACTPGKDCAKPPPPRPPWLWWSLSLAQDAQIASGSDVCSPTSQQQSGYSCFRTSGSQYLGTPVGGQGGRVSAFQLATTRALLGLDAVVAGPLTLGARAGAAFLGGGPTPAGGTAFLPLHAEGRLAYWFPGEAFDSDDFSAFAVLAGGIGEVDSASGVGVVVREDRRVAPPPSQLDNPNQQTLDAWKKSGVGFASLGVGAFIATGATHGFLLEFRGAFLFPSPGLALSLSAGFALGT